MTKERMTSIKIRPETLALLKDVREGMHDTLQQNAETAEAEFPGIAVDRKMSIDRAIFKLCRDWIDG